MWLPRLAFAGLLLACTTVATSYEFPVLPIPFAAVRTGAVALPALSPVMPDPAPEPAAAADAGAGAPDESAAARPLSVEELCETLASAAQAHDLPVAFFIRLIWQESRFDPSAISRAGAQGVAQFMPKVAAAYGLNDPFDPVQALPVSARFLGELRRQFGNLGLAAAAYNAGAGRIKEWLAKRGKLPKETRSYVTSVTGQAPERWVSAQPRVDLTVPRRAPCADLAAAAAQAEPEAGAPAAEVPLPPARPRGAPSARAALLKPHAVASRPRALEGKPREADRKAEKVWGVRLAANWSEAKVRDAFAQLRKKHPALLGRQNPVVVRSKLAGRGATINRIQLALNTRANAEQLCASLKSAGGACVVLRD